MDWRERMDSQLKEELDLLLQGVHKEKNSYLQSKSPSNAQLWCALAILTRKISLLELQIKNLEKKKTESPSLKKAMKKL